jgi:hypothetical protein
MKKIFTVLVAAASVTVASAQSNGSWGHGDKSSKDVVFNQPKDDYKGNTANYGFNTFNTREKDAQIQRINREFDQKIASVQRDRHMRYYEKQKQIKMLERQRDEQVREVQQRFSRDQHDGRFDNNRKW